MISVSKLEIAANFTIVPNKRIEKPVNFIFWQTFIPAKYRFRESAPYSRYSVKLSPFKMNGL